MTYHDWLQWKNADAISSCPEAVRDRLRRFVQNHIRRIVSGRSKPGEKERRPLRPEWEARCREWTEETPEARQRCGELFDSYMTRGKSQRYKDAMLSRKPTGKEVLTERDFAASWSGYAEDCVRSMFHEELRREIIVIPTSRSSGVDAPSVESFANKRFQSDDGEESLIEDIVAQEEPSEAARDLLPEVLHVIDAESEKLSARDKLLLWGAAHGLGRTSPRLCELTGVGKSVVSSSFRDLEERIVRAVADHFDRPSPVRAKTKSAHADSPHGVILGICWDHLLAKFYHFMPEKRPDGTFDLVPAPPP